MRQPGWCTNWDAYDLPRLWQMVSGEGDNDGWVQVQAWFRLRSAVEAQRQRLQACRQALLEQWPPDASPASAAFIAYLDHLIFSMAETARSAENTGRGLAGIMNALATAKTEMKPLYDEWRSTSTDLVPRWWDQAEDELNAKARAIMAKAELAVADYTPMIEIPAQYDPWRDVDPGTPFGPPGSAGQISTSPSGGIGPAAVASSPGPAVPHVPPPPFPGVDPLLPGGPVLSGAPAPAMVPPTPAAPGLSGGPGIGIPGGHGALPTPPITGPLPGRGTAGGSRRPMSGDVRPVGPRGGAPVTPAIPPGAMPGRAVGMPGGGRPPTAGAPMMATLGGTGARGNAGQPGTASPAYHGGGGHPAHTPGAPRRAAASNSERETWSANEGVTPVITPSQSRPHDPGPGIIGINR